MNPILPLNHFVPDGEARLMPDGSFYLYGSYDISGETAYCSHKLHVFSTDNLIDWTDHGICLQSSDIPWAGDGELMYAPDCIYKDGNYYLYFCMTNAGEGVAVSDKPYGYFKNPVPVDYANGDSIDPAIFIDDDGQAYYYWGQFHLNGAKLNTDMHTLDLSTLKTALIDEKRHGFHEGASIRKRNGLYYLVYTDISRGQATCMSYAVSSSPLGPFKKGGVIIDNYGCDPMTWNNHGCIAEFKGQWYVFYHRSSQHSQFNRRMCIEPIYFDQNGWIHEVCLTTQGCEPALPSSGTIAAARACQMKNGLYITPDETGCEILSHASNGCWAAYRYIEFNFPRKLKITAASLINGGTVEIWADDEVIGSCEVTPTGSWRQWQEFACELKPVGGTKTLYLVFHGANLGKRLMEIKELAFS